MGKGSKRRPEAIPSAYADNYDRIFRKVCEACGGTGEVSFVFDVQDGEDTYPVVSSKTCPECGGKGG